jgi:hypothetical protein
MHTLLELLNKAEYSLTLIKMLTPALMAILFLQSGIDKVWDYKGNRAYLTEHFKNTPLSIFTPFLIPTITFLEILSGVLCAIGTFSLYMGNGKWAFMGLLCSAISFLCLFLGQRIAKDYGGAASLVSYFVLNVLGLLLLV